MKIGIEVGDEMWDKLGPDRTVDMNERLGLHIQFVLQNGMEASMYNAQDRMENEFIDALWG